MPKKLQIYRDGLATHANRARNSKLNTNVITHSIRCSQTLGAASSSVLSSITVTRLTKMAISSATSNALPAGVSASKMTSYHRRCHEAGPGASFVVDGLVGMFVILVGSSKVGNRRWTPINADADKGLGLICVYRRPSAVPLFHQQKSSLYCFQLTPTQSSCPKP